MAHLSRDDFNRLVLAELDHVDRLARSLAPPPESDDLVQETYLRALRSWHTFTLGPQGVRPWLYTILHNVYRTRLSQQSRLPRPVDDEQLDQVYAAPPPPDPPLANAAQTDTDLGAALQQLDPDLRAVLLLWAVDELSYREMASVLGIPIGTVMSRLYRARRKLAAKLPPDLRARLPETLRTGGEETTRE
ncbi:MAG: sigma-70 family RNA polymerase sigma factor [Tepidisphaerales bacterium]